MTKDGNTCLKPEMTHFRVEIDPVDEQKLQSLAFHVENEDHPSPLFQ